MIYLIISNRPEFVPFALEQAEKCSGVNVVVLGNGKGFDGFQCDAEFHYKPEWRFNSDCFNWLQSNCKTEDDLFLMDDDIHLHSDIMPEIKKWLQGGFDRVVFTQSYLYDTKEQKTALTNWVSRKVGGAWAINKDLWRHSKWPEWPVDAMVGWFKRLPEHNLKMIPKAEITHLIHDKNVVLKPLDKYDWTEQNNELLTQELEQFKIR